MLIAPNPSSNHYRLLKPLYGINSTFSQLKSKSTPQGDALPREPNYKMTYLKVNKTAPEVFSCDD